VVFHANYFRTLRDSCKSDQKNTKTTERERKKLGQTLCVRRQEVVEVLDKLREHSTPTPPPLAHPQPLNYLSKTAFKLAFHFPIVTIKKKRDDDMAHTG
jgi:hypothetical protein